MTIAELIAELQQYPGELQVVMSTDGEGNDYSPLYGMGAGTYNPDSTWCGSFESEENYVDEELADLDLGEAEWDDALFMKQKAEEVRNTFVPNAICLWPVN